MATALLQTDGVEGGTQMWVPKHSSTKTNGKGSVYLQYFNKTKINHLKKIALWVVALTNTSRKAWPLVAAVIQADARHTNSLVQVRFELGPWPHWVQLQVPAALRLPTYTKLSGNSFPVASTCAAGWVEEDPSNIRATRPGTHTWAQAQTVPHHVSLASLGNQPRTHP